MRYKSERHRRKVMLEVRRRGYYRHPYIRSDGTHVKGAYVPPVTYLTTDRGEPGRTPEKEKWFNPKTHTGWKKNLSAEERRRRLKKGGVSDLTAGRRALALSNVTTDPETKRLAREDAEYFFRRHKGK